MFITASKNWRLISAMVLDMAEPIAMPFVVLKDLSLYSK
jgi:hypothetical protein